MIEKIIKDNKEALDSLETYDKGEKEIDTSVIERKYKENE